MNKIRRWLLFLAAITGLLSNVSALKATSLIFGKGPPTTSTTTNDTPLSVVSGEEGVTVNDDQSDDDGVTKPPLTGIPQIDYVWDPNLPRELNGFNLSTYPFLSLVPESDDIDFRCDGLHDGFYASIKFSCQLYHHCIYGVRHDFLCANFTAFDQKTFICQFVSEVDCERSPKYWFRNDALYKATTTTSTTTTTIAPPTTHPPPNRPLRPAGGRRPLRRRRPAQFDYYYDEEDYDDDYVVEERVNRRRKPSISSSRNRKRPRPQPISDYDDDYADSSNVGTQGRRYSDDNYEKRPSHNRDRANSDRYRNRDRDLYDYEDDEPPAPPPRNRKRPTSENRRFQDDRNEKRNRPHSDDRYSNERRASSSSLSSSSSIVDPVPAERPRSNQRRRGVNDDRRQNSAAAYDESKPVPRKQTTTQPPPRYDDDDEEYDDDIDSRSAVRSISSNIDQDDSTPKVRPSGNGASVFNRPRPPPRINRPVPINDKKKYEYVPKPSAPSAPAGSSVDEYEDDDYEYEASAPVSAATTTTTTTSTTEKIPEQKLYPQRERRPLYNKKQSPAVQSNDRSETSNNRNPADEDEQVRGSYKYSKTGPTTITRDGLPSATGSRGDAKKSEIKYDTSSSQYSSSSSLRSGAAISPSSSSVDYSNTKYRLNNMRVKQQQQEKRTPSTVAPQVPQDDYYDDDLPLDVAYQKPPAPTTLTTQKDEYLPFKTKYHRFSTVKDIRSSDLQSNENAKYDIDGNDDHSDDGLLPPVQNVDFKLSAPSAPSAPAAELDDQNKDTRSFVRVVKRPFLPSRGGNPYLPRGLKPVGAGLDKEISTIIPVVNITPTTTSTTATTTTPRSTTTPTTTTTTTTTTEIPITTTDDLIEHYDSREHELHYNNNNNQPLSPQYHEENLHKSQSDGYDPSTTREPQIESPRTTLEKIYNSEYDVTLNDALNPTLKPLAPSRSSPIGFSLSNRYYPENAFLTSDISNSPSQIHASALQAPLYIQSKIGTTHQQQQQQQQQHHHQPQLYDDYEY